MLRPLPLPEPERLVNLWVTDPERNPHGDHRANISYPNYLDMAEQAELFEGIAAFTYEELTLQARSEADFAAGRKAHTESPDEAQALLDRLKKRPAPGLP